MLKDNYTHSIMFHHFHDEKHPVGQGSLSVNDFEDMLDWLQAKYQILNADEYLFHLENSSLKKNQICLSFDDALLCQSDIAAPILGKRKITAFFFVYSSPFCGDPDPLEVYRYFRTTNFSNIDEFYKAFFLMVRQSNELVYEEASLKYDSNSYLSAFPFYTLNDKWFRFLRDQVLGRDSYRMVMDQLMSQHKFDVSLASKKLWMSEANVRDLANSGHIIGLHSYSHPTTIHQLDLDAQHAEYEKNFDHLTLLLGESPIAMSHPCGNYNYSTLEILKKFGIKIGFRSNNSVTDIVSNLEVPRNDHANIFKEMKSENNSIHQ